MREERNRQGLTLRDLAARVTALGFPTDYTALSKIERGVTNVDVEKLVAIADALDVVPDRLLRDPNRLNLELYRRLRARWETALTEIKRNEALAVALLAELNELAERVTPDTDSGYTLHDDLEDASYGYDVTEWRLNIERPPLGSEQYEQYLEALATGQAFTVQVNEPDYPELIPFHPREDRTDG